MYNNTLCAINQNVSHLDAVEDDWTILQPNIDHPIDDQEFIDVPYLDELLFVHKPSNILTLPGIGSEKQYCLASAVNDWLNSEGQSLILKSEANEKRHEMMSQRKGKSRRENMKKSIFTPRPCHRLDYDTSGIVVIALSKRALSCTSNLFEEKYIEKQYTALLSGHPSEDSGTINWPVGKIASPNGFNEFACLVGKSCLVGNRWVNNVTSDDFVEGSLRYAETDYIVSKRFAISSTSDVKYAKVQLFPKTGRGHQLRLHSAAMDHPILGDCLHGPLDVAATTPRLCLHAEKISMNVRLNSTSNVFKITVCAPPPF